MVASAALFAFLLIRNAPPHCPAQWSIHRSSIKAVFHQGHRPHFDSDRFDWSAPAKPFLPYLPGAESPYCNCVSRVASALQTEGIHYNRPPPIS